jgi:hypothetical protein
MYSITIYQLCKATTATPLTNVETIYYHLQYNSDDDTINDHFTLNITSGELRIAQMLDREMRHVYKFHVIASNEEQTPAPLRLTQILKDKTTDNAFIASVTIVVVDVYVSLIWYEFAILLLETITALCLNMPYMRHVLVPIQVLVQE